MKKISVISLVIMLIGAINFSPVWARGGGHGVGFGGGHFGGGNDGGHFGGGIGGSHFGGGYGGGHYGGGFGGFGAYGLGYGGGFYPYGGYGYNGYGYPPAVVTVPVTPPVYIQQSPSIIQQIQPGYWHYCRNPEGYYPNVKDCPSGWEPVAPIPPATQPK